MKKYQNIMEFSEIFPVEIFSGGQADGLVLPNKFDNDLHDCMELVVNDGYAQSEGCLSPDTDDSIENVVSWLDEIGDIPNDICSILSNEDFFNYINVERSDQISVKETVIERPSPLLYTSSLEGKQATIANEQVVCVPLLSQQKTVEERDNSRRKQKIVPIYEKITASVAHHSQFEFKQENICAEGDDEFLDIIMSDSMVEEPISQSTWSHNSEDIKLKEERIKRRKRGLSSVEKRDRKKESNRNASFRYRQRKKQQKVDFVTFSQTLNEQLDTAKRSYFHAAEELLRYIKHANLIRTVKDECSKLVLE